MGRGRRRRRHKVSEDHLFQMVCVKGCMGADLCAEQGKKFGKKLGNAAIFGAGATIGGNIVNSIF